MESGLSPFPPEPSVARLSRHRFFSRFKVEPLGDLVGDLEAGEGSVAPSPGDGRANKGKGGPSSPFLLESLERKRGRHRDQFGKVRVANQDHNRRGSPMSYTHLSAFERGKIELLHEQGMSTTQIAKELGRHRTTVSREINRNGTKAVYKAQSAQEQYVQRRKACRPGYRLAYLLLREFVEEKIAEEDWSPELISGRLRTQFPDDPRMRICPESIYQAIYANRFHLDHLIPYLPQARPKRRRRGQGKTRRGPSIANRVSIHERPPVIEEREEIGHWEGDLVVGSNQDGFLVTLVERHSRRTLAMVTETKKAPDVAQAVINALEEQPVSWVKTITFDNGTEFADHHTITQQIHAAIYFADPYSAYQRGSNEQVNGLIRRYLPKGTSFRYLNQQQLDAIIEKINNRPRKCLAYLSPNEVFQKQRKQHRRALSA